VKSDIPERDTKDTEITTFHYLEKQTGGDSKKMSFKLIDASTGLKLKEHHPLRYSTLVYIIHSFVSNESKMFYGLENNDFDKSDGETQKEMNASLSYSYEMLKELRNLLIMRESNLNKVDIIFDLRDNDGKKQKDYQVRLKGGIECRELIDKRIDGIMRLIHISAIEHVPEYWFAGIKNNDLTSVFVSDLFEPIRATVEGEKENNEKKKKQSSTRRYFKGLLIKVITDFLKHEELTPFLRGIENEKDQFYERDCLLIAYQILMSFGLIELELITKHKDREARIKYMESMPQFDGDYRDIKINQGLGIERILKKHDHWD